MSSWDQSRKQLSFRTRREPTESVLYRLVYELHDELQWCWEERFQSEHGCFRAEVEEAFRAYLSCGIVRHGCAMAKCECCGHTELIAFSCKRRGLCPSCDAKRAHLFAEHLDETLLLAYPHAHTVFTIPKRLRVYFKYDRKLLGGLYQAAWQAWQDAVDDELPGMKSGAVMALHTAGELLNWHPHIHALCLYGALDKEGVFHRLYSLDLNYLTRAFADNVFKLLLERGLIDSDTVENMRTWEHSGFNVWVGEPVEASDSEGRLFLGRYLKKSPVTLPNLELLESPTKTMVRVNGVTHDGELQSRDLEPLEFLAEVSQHIPDLWEQTTRYYGVYSARNRGAKRLCYDFAGPLPLSEPVARPSPEWARCMKKVFELDPLECPKCGGTMRIKQFPQAESEIERLCKNLGVISWRAPPPLPKLATVLDSSDYC